MEGTIALVERFVSQVLIILIFPTLSSFRPAMGEFELDLHDVWLCQKVLVRCFVYGCSYRWHIPWCVEGLGFFALSHLIFCHSSILTMAISRYYKSRVLKCKADNWQEGLDFPVYFIVFFPYPFTVWTIETCLLTTNCFAATLKQTGQVALSRVGTRGGVHEKGAQNLHALLWR